MLAVFGKNTPENDQNECSAFLKMSVGYFTDLKKTHTYPSEHRALV